MHNANISNIFNKLQSDDFDNSDFRLVFNACLRISKIYFSKRSYYNKIAVSLDRTIEDLALEAIEPLFLKNPKDGKIEITRSFENLRTEIQSESHFNYILHKIVWHRTEQYLTNILKENDPVFARILKNLNYLMDKFELKKLSYLGKAYIVRNEVEEIDYKVIDENTFNEIPVDKVLVKTCSDFENLFGYIESEYEFFPAVPLILLAKRIKISLAEDYNNYFTKHSYNEGYNSIRIDELIETGTNKAVSHLNNFYLAHNKLNHDESELFIKGLKDIVEDLKNGGISRGLYEYLYAHNNDLTKEEFQAKYYQPFEYLVRILRKSIADEIRDP